jgi:hypothetical protein
LTSECGFRESARAVLFFLYGGFFLCHKNGFPRLSMRVHIVFVTQETILFLFYFFIHLFIYIARESIFFFGIFHQNPQQNWVTSSLSFSVAPLAKQGITIKAISIMVPKGAQPGDLIAASCFF